jgi:hypothetical protein
MYTSSPTFTGSVESLGIVRVLFGIWFSFFQKKHFANLPLQNAGSRSSFLFARGLESRIRNQAL